jgi:hypothetical protein
MFRRAMVRLDAGLARAPFAPRPDKAGRPGAASNGAEAGMSAGAVSGALI